MKVVIIDHEPYSIKKKERYFIDEFLNDEIIVEYWTVFNIMPYLKNVQYEEKHNHEEVVKYFNSFNSLLDNLKKLDSKTVVILEVWFKWNTIALFQVLKKEKIKFIKIDYFLSIITFFSSKQSRLKKVLSDGGLIKGLTLVTTYLSNVFLNAFQKVYGLNEPSLLFLTGKNIENLQESLTKKSLTYFDVFDYENSKGQPSMVDGKYIVFLDIYLTGHPDLKRSNLETIGPVVYYQKMNLFFNEIERDTGYQVVIAAHPQSNYLNKEFGDRGYYYNKTAELVENCEFVLTHGSLSINFAVLSGKSIVYIYTDEFTYAYNYLKNIFNGLERTSDYFNSVKINIDNYTYSQLQNLEIDKSAYEKYLNDYVYSIEYPKGNYQILKESLLTLSASHEK